jgi:hypothetical protein
MFEDIIIARWLEEAMTSNRRSPSGFGGAIPYELEQHEAPAISQLGAERYGYLRDYYEQMIARSF